MIGLFVLIILGLWGVFAVWLGKLLTRKIFTRLTINKATGETTTIGRLITLFLIALVFMLPVLDQLIAYPKWQQLCSTTGDFEWGSGMDEKKAFGRTVTTKFQHHNRVIFPAIKVLYRSMSIYDAETGELIYKKPRFSFSARAFIYLPTSSGNKSAVFLPSCNDYRSENLYRKLQLKESNN
jgi:hypothetical protein